jgi:hypothetical protein
VGVAVAGDHAVAVLAREDGAGEMPGPAFEVAVIGALDDVEHGMQAASTT